MSSHTMIHRQIWSVFLVIAAFAFVMVGAVQAAPETKNAATPEAFLQSFGDRAISILDNANLGESERRQAFGDLLASGFDVDRIAKLALGRHWRTAAESQQGAYRQVFETYLIVTYDQRLRDYSGQRLSVEGSSPVKGGAMVQSKIVGKGAPVAIDWRLSDTPDGWLIVDVVVAGVSMLVTQRNEFASIVERQGGVDGLIGHLQGSVQTTDAS